MIVKQIHQEKKDRREDRIVIDIFVLENIFEMKNNTNMYTIKVQKRENMIESTVLYISTMKKNQSKKFIKKKKNQFNNNIRH